MDNYVSRVSEKHYKVDLDVILNKIQIKYRNVRSVNGFPFDILKSALQKYIRRGLVKKAQFFACELDMFRIYRIRTGNNDPVLKSCITNFFNRLRIIYLEDIGLANPELLFYVNSKLEKVQNETSFSRDLCDLIREMCFSLHTRFYSYVKLDQRTDEKVDEASLPEYITEFKNLLRTKSVQAWGVCRKILELPSVDKKIYGLTSSRAGFLIFKILREFLPSELVSKTIQTCESWYRNLTCKESFLCCMHPILLYVYENSIPSSYVSTDRSSLKSYTNVVLEKPFRVNDYVMDKHTSNGRKNGMNDVNFAVEGSLVTLEYTNFPDFFNLKESYIQSKIKNSFIENLEKEDSILTFKARAQLVTSAFKQDTYFAETEEKEKVVVKGPFLEFNHHLSTVQSIFRLLEGVNTIPFTVKLLIPSGIKSALGMRNKFEDGQAGYFYIFKDIFDGEYKTVSKSSKVWPETEVVDFEEFFKREDCSFGKPSSFMNSANALFSFLIQIAVRKVFALGDFAYRNFIRKGEKVWNIDVEKFNIGRELRFAKDEKEILRKTLRENMDMLRSVLENWRGTERVWVLCENLYPDNDFKKVLESFISEPESILI